MLNVAEYKYYYNYRNNLAKYRKEKISQLSVKNTIGITKELEELNEILNIKTNLYEPFKSI